MQGTPIHMASTSHKILATGVGRRKTSVASVRITSGPGEIVVNGKPASKYFPGEISKTRYQSPFTVAGVAKKYSVSAKVFGGGYEGQLDSLVLGISRGLVDINEKFKTLLRNAGLLTRDSRKRQRRMIGMGGKSRRKRQSPKR